MNDLKLCPFCGGVAKLNAPGYEYYSPCWCKCTQCGAEGPTKSSELEAEKGWNERVMQSEEYKRGYDAAIRHLDRYKLYRKFIRPMIVIYKNTSDQLCIPAENEEKWYPEEDLDDLIEKFKHLDAVFTKLGFDEKYELLYTIRNLKGEQENENY